MDIAQEKKAWRKRITEQKNKLPLATEQEYNRQIQQRLFQSSVWQNATHVALYCSVKHEVDTHAVIEQARGEGKLVYLPKCEPSDKRLTFYQVESFDQLETVYYGIPEPNPAKCVKGNPEHFNLIIVPGLVFDHQGYRIGYGGGYYDRFLQQQDPETPLISLAFPFQVTRQSLPVESFDIPVDQIVQPQETIVCLKIKKQ